MSKRGVYKNCIRCNKVFYEYPYLRGKKLYCSTNCANKANGIAQSKTKRKKARYNYSNDVEWRYTVLYNEWRNFCIARDNSKCRNCGKELIDGVNVVVHHIKPWDEYPELRYEVDNGLTLCRKCHNVIDPYLGVGRNGKKKFTH